MIILRKLLFKKNDIKLSNYKKNLQINYKI